MKTRFLILAAGQGKRMNSDVPKALMPVAGKPILQYLYESIQASGVDGDPIVVIGHERTKLCETFGGTCTYVVQEEQLGTGHAVKVSQEAAGDAEALIVLYGDHPFVSSNTLQELEQHHRDGGGVITMMTTTVPSFEDWHKAYKYWGRIVRDSHGHIIGIKEYKDAMQSEREILEVNPALYCFDTTWLWKNIEQLKNFNASEEYYLTDLIELAVAQGHEIHSMSIPPEEAVGINTQEELQIAEEVLAKRNA